MSGRAPHRSKRSKGWLSGSKRGAKRKGMPLWQWILAVPLILFLLAGIALFGYLTMFNPKLGAGARTVRVAVLERVETRATGGALDTSASYLVVNVDQTRLRLAPRLPDWNQVVQGDVIEVDVAGTGAAVQAIAWRATSKGAPPATPAAPPAPAEAPPGSR